MSYSRACEILGLTTPKSLEANAKLAKSILASLDIRSPLRYGVACMVIIREAK